MLEISEMVERIQGSERSQRRVIVPEGAIKMHMGEPDFPTPIHIQEAATKAMRDNFTHYGNPYGDEELREAVCFSLKRDYGVERKPESVLISAGGIEAIHAISATYLNPGDEVLILDPEYSAYADSVSLFGGRPVFVPLIDQFHLVGLGSGHSNILKKQKKTTNNTSILVLIDQFSCKNWPIKDGGC